MAWYFSITIITNYFNYFNAMQKSSIGTHMAMEFVRDLHNCNDCDDCTCVCKCGGTSSMHSFGI